MSVQNCDTMSLVKKSTISKRSFKTSQRFLKIWKAIERDFKRPFQIYIARFLLKIIEGLRGIFPRSSKVIGNRGEMIQDP